MTYLTCLAGIGTRLQFLESRALSSLFESWVRSLISLDWHCTGLIWPDHQRHPSHLIVAGRATKEPRSGHLNRPLQQATRTEGCRRAAALAPSSHYFVTFLPSFSPLRYCQLCPGLHLLQPVPSPCSSPTSRGGASPILIHTRILFTHQTRRLEPPADEHR